MQYTYMLYIRCVVLQFDGVCYVALQITPAPTPRKSVSEDLDEFEVQLFVFCNVVICIFVVVDGDVLCCVLCDKFPWTMVHS